MSASESLAMRVVASHHQPFVELEIAVELGVHDGDELLHLAHGLGTDAVAGKQQKGARCHTKRPFGNTMRAPC